MDLESKKYKIIEKLMKVSDEETLYKIDMVINNENTSLDSISDLPKPIQRLLEQSELDIKEGRVHSHEDVMKEIRATYNLPE